jgi:uncharacterized membrane protein YidH (DUF202 family)
MTNQNRTHPIAELHRPSGAEAGRQGGPSDGRSATAETGTDDLISAIDTICRWGRERGSGKAAPAKKDTDSDAFIINEAQLILAEKRTSLAAMRTGIAVFAIPLSVLGLLIATSRYYDVIHVLPLILPLVVMLTALIALGTYLVVRALLHIRRYDRLIMRLKQKHSRIAEFLD